MKHFGSPGHLIVSDRCRFHLHTHVGGVCVSTIGEYVPMNQSAHEEIGSGRLYETMVFQLGEDGQCGASYTEIDSAGYNDALSADLGHEAMVKRWAKSRRRWRA